MKRLNLIQGSTEWRAVRGQYPCASEAPVIMGASRHMTRGELLRLKAAGMEKEFSDYVQRMVLDKGHQVEAPAREITERQIGEKLYPVTALDDAGEYLASLDGITMAEDWILEHKQWSEELAAAIRAGATEFPDGQEWQMEQQLIVAEDAECVIFVCSDGTEERRVQMEYRRVPGRAEQLRAGWAQFFHDLENGDHTPAPPKAIAPPMEALPAVMVRMEGSLRVVSNLDVLAPALRAYIDRIPAKPSTDEEFAHAEAACKTLKKVEEALDAQEESALASLEAFEQMRRLKATLHKLARDTRLQREKLVDARKLEIRKEEIERGKQGLAVHIAGLNVTIGKPYMPAVSADFAAEIKGLRTVQSVRDAIDQHLADRKLAANDIAGNITVNLRALRELAAEVPFLFADTAQLVLKAPEDCRAVITSRIAEHKAAEERRLEAERARIRAEEEAKAQAKARAQQEAQETEERRQRAAAEEAERQRQAAAEAEQRRQEANAAASAAMQAISEAKQAESLPAGVLADLEDAATGIIADMALTRAAATPSVIPLPTRPAAVPSQPTLTLGAICKRLAANGVEPTLPAAYLAALGVPPAATEKNARLYSEADFVRFCAALVQHIQGAARQQEAA